MLARKYTIVVKGETDDALQDAVNQCAKLLKQGYLSGSDRSEDAGFYFNSTSEVPDGEMPAD